ncbi:MAG TPA: hypothetical protein VE135_01145 [Pyrinomonadaceae bacterium]|nr:hypothetical protein [Pyrinomonadaceae bacterium]
MPNAWNEAGLPNMEISREEIAATKAEIRRRGSDGYVEMMKVMHPMALAHARFYPQEPKLQLACALVWLFNLLFLLIVPLALFLTTSWYWGLAAVVFYYLVLNLGVQSALNLELGARMVLLDRKMEKWSESSNIASLRPPHRELGMPSVLDQFLKGIGAEEWPTTENDLERDLELFNSYAFSLFGLADGNHAAQGVLMGAGLERLRESLIKVISPMLKSNERKLLHTPMQFARVQYIDAAHVFDLRANVRWIVLNIKLFGALYAANDRFHELLSAGMGRHPSQDALAIALKFPERISHLFLGTKDELDSWIFRLETQLRPDIRAYVWANTSFQQVFLTLHEMGHAFLEHGRASATAIGPDVSVWQAKNSRYNQEIEADLFASRHMAEGPWPESLSDNPMLISAMFQFFECLELLRKMGRYSPNSHPLPRERFHRIATAINQAAYINQKVSFDHYQSVLDDVYTAWELNSQEG